MVVGFMKQNPRWCFKFTFFVQTVYLGLFIFISFNSKSNNNSTKSNDNNNDNSNNNTGGPRGGALGARAPSSVIENKKY